MNIVYNFFYPENALDMEFRDDVLELNMIVNNFLYRAFNAYNSQLYKIVNYNENTCLLCNNVSCKKMYVNWRLCKNHLPAKIPGKFPKSIFNIFCGSTLLNMKKYNEKLKDLNHGKKLKELNSIFKHKDSIFWKHTFFLVF